MTLRREPIACQCEVSTLSGAEFPEAVGVACANAKSQGENKKGKKKAPMMWQSEWQTVVDEHRDPAGLVYFSDAPPGTGAWCAVLPPFLNTLQRLRETGMLHEIVIAADAALV